MIKNKNEITETSRKKISIPWKDLSEKAWGVRDNSTIFNKTKVGVAILSDTSKIYVGCNIEQIYRSHDIHAEVNAIGNMISSGEKKLCAVLVVAERDLFTPCGACMDWIMQFGGENCIIGFQQKKHGAIKKFTAKQLMPHYPK